MLKFTQRDVYGLSVVCDDVELPPLDDVHLLADVALAAHVVTGREHLKLQLQDEVDQEALLAVLENADLKKKVMDIYLLAVQK